MNKYEQESEIFIEKNPHYFLMFDKFARQLLDAGHKTISAYLIFERMRWETSISNNSSEWKCNNNYRPYFARRWMRENNMPGVFKTRILRAN